jgi:hypothetical protein
MMCGLPTPQYLTSLLTMVLSLSFLALLLLPLSLFPYVHRCRHG